MENVENSLSIEDALKNKLTKERGYDLHVETANQYPEAPALPEELIEKVLRKGHKMVLAGTSDSGKTSMLLYLGLACSQGKPWFELQTQRAHILFVNLEIESTSFIKRIHEVSKAYGLNASDKRFHFITHRGGNLEPERFCAELKQKIVESKLEGIDFKLVIIDPVYKLIGTGGPDESSNLRASRLISGLGSIAEVGDVSFAISVDVTIESSKFQVTHEVENGVGQLARDADSLLTMWPLERHESAFRLKGLLREFEAFPPMSLNFNYPKFENQNELDRIPIVGTPIYDAAMIAADAAASSAGINVWKVWDSLKVDSISLDELAKALDLTAFETRQKIMQLEPHPQRPTLRLRMSVGNKVKAEE